MGGMVYRPIGREWYNKNFWHVFEHPATVEQYLGIGGNTPDGSRKLNEVINYEPSGVYQCFDIDSEAFNRAVTLDYFQKMRFDFVIATIPTHIEPFKKLIAEYAPEAKLIYQIGNAWTIAAGEADNIMASAYIDNVPDRINFISYHQEFDLDIFRPQATTETNTIFSFINAYGHQAHFSSDWAMFKTLEKLMPDWDFKSFGGSCRDGALHGTKQVAEKISRARFVWHVKAGGDGYGHIIHNAFAMGIPPIVKMSYYRRKMAGDLMIDGATCINIDDLTPKQIIEKVTYYNDPDRYREMRQKAYAKFKEKVDFDAEEANLRQFLANCLTP